MDEEYDVIVCGTGLNECILSGLLSVHGKKVLHLDRNSYYGGESASLNLTNLFEKFQGPGAKPPAVYGANRDWNVDLIPKFIMANGKLVKILLRTKVTRYLEWKVIEGTFVYQHQKAGWFTGPKFIHKVPATDKEALTSPLMPLMEKMRCQKFFQLIANWNETEPSTWGEFDPAKTSMRDVYKHFGLQSNTIDFIGHAIALYTNDDYMNQPMGPTMEKLRLYMLSLSRYGSSPFIYPIYGLGGLPEGFSRLSAVHGGVYMLNTPVESFVYAEDGTVCGVKTKDGQVAKCKMVVCDPSYAPETKKKLVGKVIRVICIMNHPIPGTDERSSCQIILPQKQLNRHNDIYITLVSAPHGVANTGKYIAMISTTVESKGQDPLKEIEPALLLLGDLEQKFVNISEVYDVVDNGKKDNLFVTKSYDATSHFETAAEDVLRVWENIVNEPLDLTIASSADDEE